jgi:DNA uptake protein ComE-like DNA-binding protein
MERWKNVSALLSAVLLVLPAACDQGRQTEEAGAPPAEAPAPAGEPSAGGAETARLLNPNEATPEELAAVPGLDPQAADALVEGRPYRDMLAVDRALAKTMSETEREAVYRRLWLPVDANTASREELALIPGVGERMIGEIEEYRPYTGVGEFRREIGKYVDEQEVRRLERYFVFR